jgi:hypothetical protein
MRSGATPGILPGVLARKVAAGIMAKRAAL